MKRRLARSSGEIVGPGLSLSFAIDFLKSKVIFWKLICDEADTVEYD